MLSQNHQKIHAINNVTFTQREVDIASCILHHRGSKKIAEFLSISPKTAEAHTRNIMLKLGCHGREMVIDFLEKSQELALIKKHYALIRFSTFFEKKLKEIRPLVEPSSPICKITYDSGNSQENLFFTSLIKHLKLAGISVEDLSKKKEKEESQKKPDYFIAPFSEASSPLASKTEKKNSSCKTIYLVMPDGKKSHTPEQDCLSFAETSTYHKTFFSLLSRLVPDLDLSEALLSLETFLQQSSFSDVPTSPKEEISRSQDKFISVFHQYRVFFEKNKIFASFLLLCIPLFFVVPKLASYFVKSNDTQLINEEISLRSDLPVPDSSLFLERPHLLKQIGRQLKQSKKKIKTTVLVGIGGSGKTTLARQYARKTKEKLIWEINAQTRKSLRNSFEALAYALSQSPKDKRELQIIKNLEKFEDKEKQLLHFVRKKLQSREEWFLIYDNVHSFSGVKDYFPHDSKVWGRGKIIMTSQNSNIKNSHYITPEKIITVPPLNEREKVTLYHKILFPEKIKQSVSGESAKRFVGKLPPFPLDLSVAAYYLRSSGISPEKYLRHLEEEQESLSKAQENILADVSDYTKTRHRIVTLSLEKLLQEHEEFKELFLLISLIGANRIPVDLLKVNRDEIVLERFLYHLQKYSLITFDNETKNSFSMHRSTQSISLKYLQKKLDFNKNPHFINTLALTLKKFVTDAADEYNESKMRSILPHVVAFKKNENLFSNDSRGKILTQFSRVYYYLGDYDRAIQLLKKAQSIYEQYHNDDYHRLACVLTYIGKIHRNFGNYDKAKELLEKSIEILNMYESSDRLKYAWIAAHLGNVYRSLGHYKKSVELLEESLAIYKKHYGENHIRVAWISVHLGRVYVYLGKDKEAYNLISKSYKIYSDHYSEIHSLTNWVKACLGKLHYRLGNLDQAKKLLKSSHGFYEKYYGPEHIQTAWVLRNLGRVYLKDRNFNQAEKNFKHSFDILRKKKNSDQYRSLELLSDTYLKKAQQAAAARNYKDAKRYDNMARETFKKSCLVVKKYFSSDSPHAARLKEKSLSLYGSRINQDTRI